MKTITSCVETIVSEQPYLEEALSKGIINYSALAEHLQPSIEKSLNKSVKTGAIMMGLRRYAVPSHLNNSHVIKNALHQLGDITLRSNLSNYTFRNSHSLTRSYSEILTLIKEDQHIFFTFTRGIRESNLIISSSEREKVKRCFKNETVIDSHEELSAISISLPVNNSKIPGLYYHIFKQLAWKNIPLYEVISTSNEFIVVVEYNMVNKAFAVINDIKTK